jgi:WD40 repeat protein
MKTHHYLLALFVLVSLSACTQTVATQAPTQSPSQTLLPTTTPMPTITITISPTPTPTATATPTATPTAVLPIGLETPLPEIKTPITIENVSFVQELARYGAGDVQEVAFSADQRIAVIAKTSGLVIYDTQKQTISQVLDIPVRGPDLYFGFRSLNITPDGANFLTIDYRRIRVYSIEGVERWSIETPPETNGYGSFPPSGGLSPDGSMIAIAFDLGAGNWQVSVYRIADNSLVFSTKGLAPEFSPDGAFLAVSTLDQVFIWNTSDWAEKTNFVLGSPYRTFFSPDGRTFAIARDRVIEFWRLADRKLARVIDLPSQSPKSLLFSPNGSIVAVKVGWSEDISVWSIADGTLLKTLPVRDSSYYSNPILRVTDDGEVVQIDPPLLQGERVDYQNRRWQFGFGFFGENQDLVKVNDAWAGLEYQTEYCQTRMTGPVDCFQLGENTVGILDSDGNLVTSIYDEIKRLLVVSSGIDATPPLLELPVQASIVQVRGISKDGNYLLIGMYTRPFSNKTIVYDLANSTRAYSFNGFPSGFAFYGEHNLLLVLNETNGARIAGSSIHLLDLEAHSTLYTLRTDAYNTIDVADVSQDGAQVAYIQRVYSPGSQDEHRRLQIFSAVDDQPLVSVRINKSNPSIPSGGGGYPSSISFSPDGKLLLVGYRDGMIQVYEPSNGNLLREWQAHVREILNLAFTNSGNIFASSSEDNLVKIWGLYP